MTWKPAEKYSVMIGGLLYRNVGSPIVVNGESLIEVSRNSIDDRLAVSLDLRHPSGREVASIRHNEIALHNRDDFEIVQGLKRIAIVERNSGRVWCDIDSDPIRKEVELAVSCVLFTRDSVGIFLHPNRSKFGCANDDRWPAIANARMIGARGRKTSAFGSSDTSFYLLGIEIEDFDIGISLDVRNMSGNT